VRYADAKNRLEVAAPEDQEEVEAVNPHASHPPTPTRHRWWRVPDRDRPRDSSEPSRRDLLSRSCLGVRAGHALRSWRRNPVSHCRAVSPMPAYDCLRTVHEIGAPVHRWPRLSLSFRSPRALGGHSQPHAEICPSLVSSGSRRLRVAVLDPQRRPPRGRISRCNGTPTARLPALVSRRDPVRGDRRTSPGPLSRRSGPARRRVRGAG